MSDFWELVKSVWNDGLYGVNVSQILIAIAIISFAMIFRQLFTRIIIRQIERLTAHTKNEIDDQIIDSLEAPIRFVPIVIGFFLATAYLELSEDVQSFVDNVNRSLVAFTLFWALHKASDLASYILQKADRMLSTSMISWLAKMIKAAFIVIGSATILEIWGIEVAPLIAGLGLFGVAVALGAQDVFKNLIAGLFIIGERRFNPGDWVLVTGIVEGTVEHIGFRTTTIRRFDKAPVYVPNSQLADNAVTNFSRMTYRRIKWLIGIEYSATSDQLRLIRAGIEAYIAENKDFARPDETATFVHIDRFSDSSIDILLYAFTRTTDWIEWLKVKEELLLKIKELVEATGTGFAFPSRSLYIAAHGSDLEAIPQAKENTHDT